MNDVTVNIDLSRLGELTELIKSAVDSAVNDLAIEAGKQWMDAINGANLPEGTKHDYAKMLRIDRAGWGHFIVSADYAKADQIEEGTPGRDLKRMLQTSTKTRQGKNGKYLIIPMRANTPGQTATGPAMSPAVYAIARQLPKSSVVGMGSRISATGHQVAQARYAWGGRLADWHGQGISAQERSRMAGMVRMDTSTGKSNSSAYLVFRVMSEHSNGWLIPAKPGLHIARDVAAEMQRMAPGFMDNRIAELLGS
jgi:hypothetical protein